MLPRIFHFSRMQITLSNGSHMSSMPMNNLSSQWSVNLTPQGQTQFQEDSEKSWNISRVAITTESPSILTLRLPKALDYITYAFQCFIQMRVIKDARRLAFFCLFLFLDICQK